MAARQLVLLSVGVVLSAVLAGLAVVPHPRGSFQGEKILEGRSSRVTLHVVPVYVVGTQTTIEVRPDPPVMTDVLYAYAPPPPVPVIKKPPPPPPPPPPKPKPEPPPPSRWSVDWDDIALCESSGNWHIASGNGYYGGLQFLPSTWREFGGLEFDAHPQHATPTQQKIVAERVLKVQGIHAWPVCGARGGPQDAKYARLLRARINQVRARYLAPRLVTGEPLTDWAQGRVKRIVTDFHHSDMQAMLRWVGAVKVGEVMVNGDVTPNQVVGMMMRSKPHRRFLLDRDMQVMGVAAELYESRWYVVVDVLYR